MLVLMLQYVGWFLLLLQAERQAVQKARVVQCICMGHSSMVAMVLLEHKYVCLHLSKYIVLFSAWGNFCNFFPICSECSVKSCKFSIVIGCLLML